MAKKRKIVAIDDSPNVLEVITSLLEAEGFDVSVCRNIDEAFSTVKESLPDLLILDVMMPSQQGIDGFSLCSRIKEDPETSNIRVIFVSGIAAGSGQSEEELKERAGADDFIHKPFDPKDFLARVKKQLKED